MSYAPNQGGVYAVSVVLILATTAAVGLRLRARQIKKVGLRADDYLVILSLLLSFALAVILIIGAARGTLGTDTLINPATGGLLVTWHEADSSHLQGVSQPIAIITLGILKSSIVFLYRRIFIGSTFRTVSLVVLVVIALWTVAFLFATVFECGSDYSLLWQSGLTFMMYCGRYKYIQIGHAASDVATDILVLSMPLPVIWGLHMNFERKMALSFIFLLGLISTAAGCARLAIIAEDVYETTTGSRDVRAITTNTLVWTYVEVGVAVVACCLPTLKPILDLRTPESIVASVRSKLSLSSRTSPKRVGSSSASQDYELHSYKNRGGSLGSRSGGSTADNISQAPPLPANRIIKHSELTVGEERI